MVTWKRRLIVFAVMLLCLAAFFRDALLGRLTMLYGDSYDGLIEVAILNHWFDVVAHSAAWNVTGWFAPYPDTLGYNDTYVIPGFFFTLARLAGADPFIATFVSHVAMKAIGFLGMYALLRRGLAVSTWLALAGAAIFATANASLVHIGHAQLLAVGLMPWLMLWAIGVVRALLDDDARSLWHNGIAFALLFGLAALNAFYQIWFYCFFVLIFVVVGTLVAGPARRAELRAAIMRHLRPLVELTIATGVALIPFILVYVPKLVEGGHHRWQEVAAYLPLASTYINVGPTNLVWGRILPMESLDGGEFRFGFPLGLLALTIVATFWAARDDHNGRRMVLTAGITLVIAAVLMARWTGGFTPWWFVYKALPGAASIRVITRFLLFALIPAIAMVMLLLDHAPVHCGWVIAIVAFLLVEQVQTAAPLSLDRAAQMRMLATVGPPPAQCDTFFVVSARAPDDRVRDEIDRAAPVEDTGDGATTARIYRHNVDAMLLASYYNRPTINGFSTFNPPDWRFDRPDDVDYLIRVRIYAERHKADHLGHLCSLDRRRSPQWLDFY